MGDVLTEEDVRQIADDRIIAVIKPECSWYKCFAPARVIRTDLGGTATPMCLEHAEEGERRGYHRPISPESVARTVGVAVPGEGARWEVRDSWLLKDSRRIWCCFGQEDVASEIVAAMNAVGRTQELTDGAVRFAVKKRDGEWAKVISTYIRGCPSTPDPAAVAEWAANVDDRDRAAEQRAAVEALRAFADTFEGDMDSDFSGRDVFDAAMRLRHRIERGEKP